VAGIGGRVGLKGSDGAETQRRARDLGAIPESGSRTMAALQGLIPLRDAITLLTPPGEMGEEAARACGFSPEVVGRIQPGRTTPDDTRRAAQMMRDRGASLILFAGGDGTARDVCAALGDSVPALGIPAGVKIHSAVYAINPAGAGRLAAAYLGGAITALRHAEVMDLDEDAYRQGFVSPMLKIPYEGRLVQARKSPSVLSESGALDAIALDVIRQMDESGHLFIVGPGTTTRPILAHLGLEKTLIGVDVVWRKQVISADANQSKLLELIADRPAKIVVTPIGGQGYLFGRGNQQIGPEVIRRVGGENILVVATVDKIVALGGRPLLVDSGDSQIDHMLEGYRRVITGYGESMVYPVSAGENNTTE
jgi:predicted polyphosphate/ATP-dependent NAD kinase